MPHPIPRARAPALWLALLALAAGVVARASHAGLPQPFQAAPEGARLPDYVFEERLPDGGSRELGFVELRGQAVVAVLWATWCGVCAGELPKLDALQADLASQGVLVTALSIDDGGSAAAARYLEKRGLRNLRVFHDTQKMTFATLGAYGVPTVYVADREGRIVARASGAVAWGDARVRSFLLDLAKDGTAPASARSAL